MNFGVTHRPVAIFVRFDRPLHRFRKNGTVHGGFDNGCYRSWDQESYVFLAFVHLVLFDISRLHYIAVKNPTRNYYESL